MNVRVSVVTPRLDTKPWGGRNLHRLGLDLPPGKPIGEALVSAGEAVVTEGYMQGHTLADIVRSDADSHLGIDGRAGAQGPVNFPLLVKIIDATQNLSIQVHPDDEQARPLGKPGKTEAWHVLAAEPGSLLYLGIRPGVTPDAFEAAAARLDGASAALMRTVPARPGMTVLIPAGTVHALGAGVMVYEVQQPSDVTFRLDDWGRLDSDGNPREMHLEAGLAVSRPESIPEVIEPVSLRPAVGERHLLAACRYFALERQSLPAGGSMTASGTSSPRVITLVQGAGSIDGLSITLGQSFVAWPSTVVSTFTATEPSILLGSHVPDLAADVVDSAVRAGASQRSVMALAGSTGDLLPWTTQ